MLAASNLCIKRARSERALKCPKYNLGHRAAPVLFLSHSAQNIWNARFRRVLSDSAFVSSSISHLCSVGSRTEQRKIRTMTMATQYLNLAYMTFMALLPARTVVVFTQDPIDPEEINLNLHTAQ